MKAKKSIPAMKPQMTFDEWDSIIESGKLIDHSNKLRDAFLYPHQLMRAMIEYAGKLYYATAWKPPGDDGYVIATEWKMTEVR